MQTGPSSVLAAGEGEAVRLLALDVRFMIDGETTGGALSLVEHPLPPRSLGAPIHTHHHEDEYPCVPEGRFGVQLGDECSRPARATSCSLRAAQRDEAAVAEVVRRYDLEIDFATIPLLADRDQEVAPALAVGRGGASPRRVPRRPVSSWVVVPVSGSRSALAPSSDERHFRTR